MKLICDPQEACASWWCMNGTKRKGQTWEKPPRALKNKRRHVVSSLNFILIFYFHSHSRERLWGRASEQRRHMSLAACDSNTGRHQDTHIWCYGEVHTISLAKACTEMEGHLGCKNEPLIASQPLPCEDLALLICYPFLFPFPIVGWKYAILWLVLIASAILNWGHSPSSSFRHLFLPPQVDLNTE